MSHNKRKNRCPISGKSRFRDDLEAKRALHRASSTRRAAAIDALPCRRRETRCYECDHCRGWHLTSWSSPGSPPDAGRSSLRQTRPKRPSPQGTTRRVPGSGAPTARCDHAVGPHRYVEALDGASLVRSPVSGPLA